MLDRMRGAGCQPSPATPGSIKRGPIPRVLPSDLGQGRGLDVAIGVGSVDRTEFVRKPVAVESLGGVGDHGLAFGQITLAKPPGTQLNSIPLAWLGSSVGRAED